jgi:hypothetical protein
MDLQQYVAANGKPAVGTPVYAVEYTTYGHRYIKMEVVAVTPTGRVSAKREGAMNAVNFDNKGREMGADVYRRKELDFDIAGVEARMAAKEARRNAAHAINAVKLSQDARDTWSKESMLEEISRLETLLAAAKEAVAKIN